MALQYWPGVNGCLRCHDSITVDVRLATGAWTFAEAVEYLVNEGGMDREAAEGEASGAAAWPGQKICYALGKWQIQRLLGQGPVAQPGAADVVLTMEVSTLGALLHQELSPEEALGSGRATVAGEAAALQRLVQLFALPSRAQATTA